MLSEERVKPRSHCRISVCLCDFATRIQGNTRHWHKTLTWCCFDVGTPSTTLDQHHVNTGGINHAGKVSEYCIVSRCTHCRNIATEVAIMPYSQNIEWLHHVHSTQYHSNTHSFFQLNISLLLVLVHTTINAHMRKSWCYTGTFTCMFPNVIHGHLGIYIMYVYFYHVYIYALHLCYLQSM